MVDGSLVHTPASHVEASASTPGKALLVYASEDVRLIITRRAATELEPPRLPSLERLQWEYIHAVLGSCGGNVSEAARQLGIHRQSLQRMLRRHPPTR